MPKSRDLPQPVKELSPFDDIVVSQDGRAHRQHDDGRNVPACECTTNVTTMTVVAAKNLNYLQKTCDHRACFGDVGGDQ